MSEWLCGSVGRLLSTLLCAGLLAGCSGLLFYPERGQPGTPANLGMAYEDVYLTTADRVRLHGWWLPAKGEPKGAILFLHGNGGNLAWHLEGVAWLPQAGYQVLMLDYRGYGLSEGSPGLPAVYEDVAAGLAWLSRNRALADQPISVIGQSLGGALALHYLAGHPEQQARLHALILDGVPASYRQTARHLLSTSTLSWAFQVPLSWLVPDAERAELAMPGVSAPPMLIFHSPEDPIVPFENGLRLCRAAVAEHAFLSASGGHVQTFADPAARQAALDFLRAPAPFIRQRQQPTAMTCNAETTPDEA